MNDQTPTRRERYRAQTIDEIKAIAMGQVDAGGAAAVSLNGIAKAMAMSPGALYRYFDNRDDLLAELVVDGYERLADHIERAATPTDPGIRLTEIAQAYREWALGNANTYRLIFESSSGSGHDLAPERIIPAAQRSMNVFLAAIAEARPDPDRASIPAELAAQVTRWGHRAQRKELPPVVLYLGLTFWSRVHGLISLEIGHHLQATGVDPALLFTAEIRQLIEAAGRAWSPW